MSKVKPGDIIIFDGGDNWVSKSICWLTNSTVSHAAMVYKEQKIVEMEKSNRFDHFRCVPCFRSPS